MRPYQLPLLRFLGGVVAIVSQVPCAAAQVVPPVDDSFSRLHWRFLGPIDHDGKVYDIALPGPGSGDTRPYGTVMYVASANGGLFKTENAGTTWTPLFDRELVSVMHSVALAPSNARVVWVGTGDPAEPVYDAIPGNGAYKSTDAGNTWTPMGLAATQYVARIAIHPSNPDIVFAGTLGSLSQPSQDRGLYRTRDAGATWQRVLFVNEWTGVTDVAIDPVDPSIVYAATQQRAQNALGMLEYGPGSGLFKSTDGGSTWRRLNNGLPTTQLARGALAVSTQQHTTVYAVFDNADPRAGKERGVSIYRSDDAGEHWRRGAYTFTFSDRYLPHLASKWGCVAIDPANINHVYICRGYMGSSADAGATPDTTLHTIDIVGPDVHMIRVDPTNPAHLLIAFDRGVMTTVDSGKTWRHFLNIPSVEACGIAIDRAEPFSNVHVCTNDHWTIGAPVATRHVDGVTTHDWINVFGAEDTGVLSDPTDTTVLYDASIEGLIARYDRITRTITDIGGAIRKDHLFRAGVIPVTTVLSATRPSTIYYAGDRVLRTDDRGQHWRAISPPLLRVVDTATFMGGRTQLDPVMDDGGQGISALDESPLDTNVLYAGTTDGRVHVTRDGGVTWVSSDGRGLPKGTRVSSLAASHGKPGTAYATFDASLNGDFAPYLYRTTDFGHRWAAVGDGLAAGATAHQLIEHPRNPNLLFVATARGVFVSLDAGGHWQTLRNNMPGVDVRGIALQPNTNELVVATWGRGVWILDDVTPLELWTKRVRPSEDVIFPVRAAYAYVQQPPRQETYNASRMPEVDGVPNPPYGATIFYYLRAGSAPGDSVYLDIVDQSGAVVHHATSDATKGLHEVTWNLRPDSWQRIPDPNPDMEDPERQFIEGVRPAPTGEYTVRLVVRRSDGPSTITPLAPEVHLVVRPDVLRLLR